MPSNRTFSGAYELLEALGDCDVGQSFLARRIGAAGFEKQVAIWRVDAASGGEPSFIDAVIEEASRAALLSHAGIAHVLDVGRVEQGCFVATELVQGTTLETVLRCGGPLPWSTVATLGKQAARALGYAHTLRGPQGKLLGLVHGRLSPRRMVFTGAGHIKLTGFGTSRAWRATSMLEAPEGGRGEPLDGRADVFSLGGILAGSLGSDAAPPALHRIISSMREPYQELRSTPYEVEQALSDLLHGLVEPFGASFLRA